MNNSHEEAIHWLELTTRINTLIELTNLYEIQVKELKKENEELRLSLEKAYNGSF